MNDGEIAQISEAQINAANQPHLTRNGLEIALLLLFQPPLMVFQVFAGIAGLHRLGTRIKEDQVEIMEPLLNLISPACPEVGRIVDGAG
jgi:hypothetical protein